MKRVWKRTLVCLLAAVLLCTQLVAAAFAAPPYRLYSGQQAAEQLYALDLFQGDGTLPDGSPNFALDRTLTRVEAMVLLVRLLGGEQEAMTVQYSYPYQDVPAWAAPYVGYVHHYKISDGVGSNKFGSLDKIAVYQFVTLVLRALGYSNVDWRDPSATADAVGLYYPDPAVARDGFYRADAAAICLDALSCTARGKGITLFQQLKQNGAIASNVKAPAGVFISGPVVPLVTQYTASNTDSFIAAAYAGTASHSSLFTIYVPEGQGRDYYQALYNSVYGLSNPLTELRKWSYSFPTVSSVQIRPYYSDAAQVMAYLEGRVDSLTNDEMQLLAAARKIHASLVTPGMSEYAQVKAFHDWLVNNNTYDMSFKESSYTAAGALMTGYAVCDGYSKAFDLLCYLSGIDCVRIVGRATNSAGTAGAHAWNKVKIDGQWYNVDITWDDPVSSKPILRYDYFLISDSALGRNHYWTAYSFWPTAPANYK